MDPSLELGLIALTCWGALRAAFVIDEDGVARQVISRVSPKTHDEQVLAPLGEWPRRPADTGGLASPLSSLDARRHR